MGTNPITINFGGDGGGKGTSVTLDNPNQLDQLEIIQANQYFNEGKLNEAIEIYTKLINDVEIRSAFKCQALLGRGSSLAQMLKLEEAYRDFSQILQASTYSGYNRKYFLLGYLDYEGDPNLKLKGLLHEKMPPPHIT